jgi:hypothetical protein
MVEASKVSLKPFTKSLPGKFERKLQRQHFRFALSERLENCVVFDPAFVRMHENELPGVWRWACQLGWPHRKQLHVCVNCCKSVNEKKTD